MEEGEDRGFSATKGLQALDTILEFDTERYLFALHTTDVEEFLYIEQRERYKSYLSSSIPRVLYYESYG